MKALRKSAELFGQVIGLVAGRKFDTPASETLMKFPTIPFTG
jgi:hypothetical protein